MKPTDEGVLAVLISVLVAFFGSILTYATICAEQNACLKAGTCYRISNYTMSCGFKNSITPAGWRILNMSDQKSALDTMNRGICAPGLRQSVDPNSGQIECVRKRSYPNALLAEIGDVDGTSDHKRWCGKWISAGNVATGDLKWSFFDENDVKDDINEIILAKGSGRLGTSDVNKFRSACRSMVSSNSAGPAGKLAFDYLNNKLHTIETVDQALEAVGFLASHFCDTPASVGLTYTYSGFVVNMSFGFALGGETLRQALYGVGMDHSTRDHAAEYASAMDTISGSDIEMITAAQARLVVHGSHSDSWLNVGSNFKILFDEYNPNLARFVQAFDRPDGGASRARSYIRGLAAYCSYAARSVITGEFGSISAVEQSVRSIVANRPAASALGRLKSTSVEADRFVHVDEHELLNASRVTLSSLSATSVSGATRGNARSACLRAARVAFPDDFDKITFDLMVTPRLHQRLEALDAQIKIAAESTLEDPLIGSLIENESDRTFTISLLRQTKMRIAGAPRGGWGGVEQEFVRPILTSNDGALLILLKQARAVFLDRMFKAVNDVSVCDHPPLYDALERNAYLLVSSGFSCAMLLPGILTPPFADERYNDESLVSRIGYVMAHERLHVTAFTSLWNSSYAGSLLVDYEKGTEVEAIADVAAVAAIMKIDIVDNETLCAHVSQIWCGRVGWMDGGGQTGSHPRTNERGDMACSFLRRHFS